jgi:hypothetical protein
MAQFFENGSMINENACEMFMSDVMEKGCHNPSLGLATKERACKDACQKEVWESVRMNTHTPK